MAIDPLKIEEFSEILLKKRISSWIVGTIDAFSPELVRISEDVKNIEVTKY